MVERIKDIKLFPEGPNGIRLIPTKKGMEEMDVTTPHGRAQQRMDELVQMAVKLGGIPVSFKVVEKPQPKQPNVRGISPFRQRIHHAGPNHSRY